MMIENPMVLNNYNTNQYKPNELAVLNGGVIQDYSGQELYSDNSVYEFDGFYFKYEDSTNFYKWYANKYGAMEILTQLDNKLASNLIESLLDGYILEDEAIDLGGLNVVLDNQI